MKKDLINLVDEKGLRIGSVGKLDAHLNKGQLHEAFSIFVFNKNNELLIHKRNKEKYHSGGLWANTCCSHPKFNEIILEAIHRRLKEEMGFDCELRKLFSFTYYVNLGTLVEHEYDHVFIGKMEFIDQIFPDPAEVEEYKWVSLDWLRKDIKLYPKKYVEWLKIILNDDRFIIKFP